MWVICRYVYCKIFFPTLWFAFLLSRLCLKKVKLLILMWCNLFILFLNVWKCPFWETLQVQIPEEIFLCFLLKDLLCFLYIHILKFPKVDFVVLWGRDHSFFFFQYEYLMYPTLLTENIILSPLPSNIIFSMLDFNAFYFICSCF